jgi:hypothetical protein
MRNVPTANVETDELYSYSKKLGNLRYSVALFVCYWNFCWKHTTTGQTPAQASKLTDHAWKVAELLDKISTI